MKKIVKTMLAAVMLLSATQSANAQFSTKQNNREPDRFHMGLRGGLTSNTFTGDADVDPLLFPTGGLAIDFQVAPIPIFVGLGLNYVNYGYKYDSYYGDSESEDTHAIQLPITASYHINVAPNLFINPFFGGFVSYALDSSGNVDEDLNYGLRVGCGLNYGRLTFDLGYDLGLANLGNDYYDMKTGTFFMTIGFNWAGKR